MLVGFRRSNACNKDQFSPQYAQSDKIQSDTILIHSPLYPVKKNEMKTCPY